MAEGRPAYTRPQKELIIVASLCLVVGTLAVVFRMVSRRLFQAKVWWDDCLCVFGWVVACVAIGDLILGAHKGVGRHVAELNGEEIKAALQLIFVFQLIWTAVYAITYYSVLALYIRVFPNTTLRKWSIYVGIGAGLFMISCFVVGIFQCTPVAFFWDRTIPGGHCVDQYRLYVSSSILHVLTILLLFLMPVPTVWALQLTTSRKCGLIVVFSVGAFAVVTSIVRVVYLIKLDLLDFSYNLVPVLIWSTLDHTACTVGSCVPSMTPLLMYFLGKKRPAKVSVGPSTFFSRKRMGGRTKSPKNDFTRIDEEIENARKNVELSTMTAKGIDDHVRLVDHDGKKPSEILITREIHQSNESNPDHSAGENPNPPHSPTSYPWGARAVTRS